MVIEKVKRRYLPQSFKITDWDSLKPLLDELTERNIESAEELKSWLLDKSELEAVLSEDMGWRYIRMTCYTDNEDYVKAYEYFVQQIQPRLAPYSDILNKKLAESPYKTSLNGREWEILLREVEKNIQIYRKENIPLQTEIQTLNQEYSAISGGMTIEWEGKELTLPQAGVMLQETDRKLREKVYRTVSERRIQDAEKLDILFDKLLVIRQKIAENAGFHNFRDYMFTSMGRFDYTPADCFNFHEAIRKHVVPLTRKLAEERQQKLAIDTLRPWDKAVDPENRKALKPFGSGKDLLERSISVFNRLDPFLGDCLKTMDKMGHLDLESRKGKSPGGYNYPLDETGVPFIFMNATSTMRDMTTMMHEGGHAVHSFVTRQLPMVEFRHTPSEVAELASMSMELMSMDYWDEFFKDEKELKRAKKEQLEGVMETLPWVAIIDKFQHWLYENHGHTVAERKTAWNSILDELGDGITDWHGLQQFRDYLWQKQLHLFEVPFYYIEYGMAQLGAVAVWKRYKEDPQKGLTGYLEALKLGYTKSIPEVYEAAGVAFDFSSGYVKELMEFVWLEYEKI